MIDNCQKIRYFDNKILVREIDYHENGKAIDHEVERLQYMDTPSSTLARNGGDRGRRGRGEEEVALEPQELGGERARDGRDGGILRQIKKSQIQNGEPCFGG